VIGWGGQARVSRGACCVSVYFLMPSVLSIFRLFVCPPERGSSSSWLEHAPKQRSPTTLVGVVRVVVVLVLERVFVSIFRG
jgi:hypothetical protein